MQLKDLVGRNKSYISKINKDDLVNILHNGSRELEDLADLKAIRESIDEFKNNVVKLILEENKKIKRNVFAILRRKIKNWRMI